MSKTKGNVSTWAVYVEEKFLGFVKASSEIEAAWLAWKRWPKYTSIYIKNP